MSSGTVVSERGEKIISVRCYAGDVEDGTGMGNTNEICGKVDETAEDRFRRNGKIKDGQMSLVLQSERAVRITGNDLSRNEAGKNLIFRLEALAEAAAGGCLNRGLGNQSQVRGVLNVNDQKRHRVEPATMLELGFALYVLPAKRVNRMEAGAEDE